MKVLRVLGAIGSFLLAGLLIVGNFIMDCIGAIIGAITKGWLQINQKLNWIMNVYWHSTKSGTMK